MVKSVLHDERYSKEVPKVVLVCNVAIFFPKNLFFLADVSFTHLLSVLLSEASRLVHDALRSVEIAHHNAGHKALRHQTQRGSHYDLFAPSTGQRAGSEAGFESLQETPSANVHVHESQVGL